MYYLFLSIVVYMRMYLGIKRIQRPGKKIFHKGGLQRWILHGTKEGLSRHWNTGSCLQTICIHGIEKISKYVHMMT